MSSINLQRKVISFSHNFFAPTFLEFFIFLFFSLLGARKWIFVVVQMKSNFVWEDLNSAWAINGEILPLRILIAFFVDEYIYFSIS